ncbi:MAG: hypothetical protein JNK48_16155 [Bryobacterales bacterium]|nr:hypothetical protein [Bryobacterales bacterium]
MLTVHDSLLRGAIKGLSISGTLRGNPLSLRLAPGRYKVVRAGVDPVLGGVVVLRPAALAPSAVGSWSIQTSHSLHMGNNMFVISERSLGSVASFVLDGVPRGFYSLPEVGDEVLVI